MSSVKKRRRLSEQAKISIFRWWFSGAMYFLIAWGTPLGQTASPLDLIFALGIGMGTGTIFLFDPIVYGMFDVRRRGKIVNQKYYGRSVPTGVLRKLIELFKCLFVTVLTYLLYQAVNTSAVRLFSLAEGTVVLGGEPILFATFYLFFYNILTRLVDKARDIALSGRVADETPESNREQSGRE